ncbi:GNAT family N-acetyltransferase [Rossellomorea sp. YZS02]|uniref:GNAT family N-acetyltransferase n=1 Tax=Rossellomorea sp. YZS02 TaxID=3097358 RepID=UPI002A135048|nr:GNAT family N-acetyltransferase [Rossellomorea sp. YZS02]MDX8346243.1 GNAT family N-acetyltransferase [Rossellomorea sp. YZS02]
MTIEISVATDIEVEEIFEMAGLNREEATGVPYEKHKEEMQKAYRHSIEHGAYFLVAREEDELAGWVQVDKSVDWITMKGIGWINDVYVKKSFRGRGHATKLLKQAIGELKDRDYDEVRLNVYMFNEQAIKLYEKLGFSDVCKFMKLSLE